MGVLLAFLVTRRHPASNAKQQGSNMPPAGGCLPQAFSIYCQVLDALEAGPRCLGGSGAWRKTPDTPFDFTLVRVAHFGRTKKLSTPDHLKNRSNSKSVGKGQEVISNLHVLQTA